MYCPASQAPSAGPIGLQKLFSIFRQFAFGENRHDIHSALGKALLLCRLLPAPGSNPSACSASPAPWTWAHMFSLPQICAAASTSPWSWFPGGLRDWQHDGQAPAWLQTQGLPDGLGTGMCLNAPQMPGIRGSETGRMHGRIFPSVCSLLPDCQPAAEAECAQLSVLKWQISRISDIFHDFKDISSLLLSHILKLMMTALWVG